MLSKEINKIINNFNVFQYEQKDNRDDVLTIYPHVNKWLTQMTQN